MKCIQNILGPDWEVFSLRGKGPLHIMFAPSPMYLKQPYYLKLNSSFLSTNRYINGCVEETILHHLPLFSHVISRKTMPGPKFHKISRGRPKRDRHQKAMAMAGPHGAWG